MFELHPSEDGPSARNLVTDRASNMNGNSGPTEDEEIDFDEIDDDLERFQEDEMVKSALHRGVDLKKYGQELGKQLKTVSPASSIDHLCATYYQNLNAYMLFYY